MSYPDFMDRIVATAGTAKCWPHGVVRLEAQIAAIELDTAYHGGDYTAQPKRGVELFSLIWEGWLFSQEWWRRELWRQTAPAGTTISEPTHRGVPRREPSVGDRLLHIPFLMSSCPSRSISVWAACAGSAASPMS